MSNQTVTPIQPANEQAAAGVIEEYALAEAKYTQAKEERDAVRKKLLALFPHNVGEFVMHAGKWTTTVLFPEKVKWSTEDVAAYYGSSIPSYVKQSFSIDLRALRRLPLEEQEELDKCYEIVPGTPKIDVIVN